MVINNKPAYLVMEGGDIYQGFAMGKTGTSIGEIIFNTNTASYQNILTDPTYYGQIVVQTYPMVGNRGVQLETDSRIMANGYIVRDWCDQPTDLRGRITLDEYLKARGIVGLCGIDTRALTRRLRDGGYQKAAITDSLDNLDQLRERIAAYSIAGAVKAVTNTEIERLGSQNERFNLAVVNYGCHYQPFQWLLSRGISLTLYPAYTSPADILAEGHDGILLSDGPGDPDEDLKLIENIKELKTAGKPLFGIGLGHQMLAIACGMKCEMMNHAHRGSNQPVRNLKTGKLMITTQNHGYAIAKDSIDPLVADTFLENVNDHTVEALEYKAFPGFTIQFEPSDGPGLQDTAWMFDKIAQMLGEGGNQHA